MALRRERAKEGFVWKSKRTNEILSEELILGKEDSIENYEEIKLEVEENV